MGKEVAVKRKVGRPKGTGRPKDTSRDLQDAFIAAYMDCFSSSEAARRVGIKKFANRRGYQLYHAPRVSNLIKRKLGALLKRAEITAEEMILKLQRNEKDSYDGGDLKESTRCLELMGKTIAMFTNRTEVDITVVPLGPREIVLNTVEGQKCLSQQDGTDLNSLEGSP